MQDTRKTKQQLVAELVELRASAEDRLREAETRYRAFFDHGPDGVVVLNPKTGQFVEFNDQACRQLGYTREEFSQLRVSDIEVMETAEEVPAHIAKINREGYGDFDTRQRTKQGAIRDIHVTAQVIDIGGAPVFHCVWRDITGHKRAYEEIYRSQSQYRQLIEHAEDGIFTIRPDGQFVLANRKFCEMLGYTPAEITQCNILDTYPDNLRESGAQRLSALERGAALRFERPMKRNDGGIIFIEANAWTTENGHLQAIVRDITGRKRVEEDRRFEHTLALQLGASTDLLESLKICLSAALHVSGMDCGGIYLAEESSGCFCLAWQEGLSEAFVLASSFLDFDTPHVGLINKGQPVYTQHGRLTEDAQKLREGLRALAILPIVHQNRTIACLNLASRHLEETPQEVRPLLELLSTQMGGFISRLLIEKDLRDSEEKYRELVENANSIILRMDKTGRVTFFNEFAQKFFGYAEEEITGQNVLGTIVPETESTGRDLTAMIASIAKHPERYLTNENENMRRNGERVWIAWTNKPIPGEDGEIREILCIGNDITVRKQAEENYKTLFHKMINGFALHDIICDEKGNPSDYRFLAVNPAFEHMTGLKAEDLVGRTVLEVMPGTERHWIETYGHVALTGTPAYFESYARALNKHFEVTAFRPALNQFACIFADITERKLAEQKIRDSELLYHSLVKNLPQNVFRKDKAGRFTFVNGLFCNTLGRSMEDILGKTDFDFYPQELAGQYRADDLQVMETGESLEKEEEYTVSGQAPLFVHVIKSPLRDTEGTITGVQGLFWDITEKKRMEEQLRQSQKMEAIGTLAGGIAHDFNNILQSILVFAELTQHEVPQDSPAFSNIEEILSGAKRARDLVARILAFSRQSEKERKPIQLQPIIKEALKLLRGSLPATIEIRQDISQVCGAVLGDPTRIHQIIMNLCTNAYHAMREQGGVLGVRLDAVNVGEPAADTPPNLRPSTYVRLTVQDTGCGMEPEVVARIFDPYFTTKKTGEGSGLGLSVVHGIVKELDGGIQVKSIVKEGTVFEVFLPVCAEAPRAESNGDTEGPAGKLTGTGCILVVDDEMQIGRSVGHVLRRYGYTVDTFSNSLEALEHFRAAPRRYDAVITDQTMPHLTGMDLAHKLLGIQPDLPIILCTGYSDLVDDASAKTCGIREFLTKPFLPGVLAEALQRVLSQK